MKIVLKPNQKLFFTSDTHYSHANICSATTQWERNGSGVTFREFDSLDDMNRALVSRLNERVGEDDILFHVGDWSFGGFDKIEQFRSQIVCKNIHLLYGNHDHHIERNKDGIQSLFASTQHYLNLTVKWEVYKNQYRTANFVLMHYPIASWDGLGRSAIHLHGHVHLPTERRIGPGRMMDVGVDGNGLYPIEMTEVLSIMRDRPVKGLLEDDHHEIEENYK